MIVFTVLLPYHCKKPNQQTKDSSDDSSWSFLCLGSWTKLCVLNTFLSAKHKSFGSSKRDSFPTHFQQGARTVKEDHNNQVARTARSSSCLNRTGYHAVWCIRELRGHGCYLTSGGIGTWASFWKINLPNIFLKREKGLQERKGNVSLSLASKIS